MEFLEQLQLLGAFLFSRYSSNVSIWSTVAVAFVVLFRFFDFDRGRRLSTAPIVGASSVFEPLFITKYRFSQSGWATVQQGYEKVRKTP